MRRAFIAFMVILITGLVFGGIVCAAADNPEATAKLKKFINKDLSARHASEIKALLDQGADINTVATKDNARADLFNPSHTLLWAASYYNRPEIVKLLLYRGAEVDKTGTDTMTPLFAACQEGHSEIVMMLLAKGARVDKASSLNGDLPLHAARGNMDIVRMLLAKGADVNKANSFGDTLLFRVAGGSRTDVVKLLIEHGAQVDKATDRGKTPLMDAVEYNRMENAKLLLDKGAQVDKAEKEGLTSLHIACRNGYPEMTGLLIDKGAGINRTTNDGKTPLFIAVEEGKPEIVKLLIGKGADVNRAKKTGVSPLMAATAKGHKQITEILKQNGAKELPAGDSQAAKAAEYRDNRLRKAKGNFGRLQEGMTIAQTREMIGPFTPVPVSDIMFQDIEGDSFRLENELYVIIFKDNKLKCWKWNGANYLWPDWYFRSPRDCESLNKQLKEKEKKR